MRGAKPGDGQPADRDGGRQVDRDDDVIDAPFADDAERAEFEWLLARAQDPSAPAPSPAIAREYAELEGLLEGLPAGDLDESWHEEVLQQAVAQTTAHGSGSAPVVAVEPVALVATERPRPGSRRTHRWVAAGVLAAIAAAAMAGVVVHRARSRSFLDAPRPEPDPMARLPYDAGPTDPDPAGLIAAATAQRGLDPDELKLELRRGEQVRGSDKSAAVGDRLILQAPLRGTSELRVYRADGLLVERCPEGPGCTISAEGAFQLDLVLEAPVEHYVILVDRLTAHLPVGTLDEYLQAASAAGARIQTQRIEVH